ncbi:DUF4124 domain-containing protein [Stenotrophomonas sp. Iso1]|uniref:DUF4124 domain-containing protein n=1 Tax=Stenotrophomonas sp. Iso1 TaxID=2977283 RepID=UPI0022B784A4|nr:DUF4124 domain-containing protein [Stenotrophomonas sp. Iso1]
MKCLLVFTLLLTCGELHADEVIFYRCTDATGALTVQNMPCPKGMQQTTKVMQAVATPPPTLAPVATPAAAVLPVLPVLSAAPHAPPVAAPKPPVAPVARKALPPLFQCRTREGQNYLSETSDPPGRCLALRVTGLDGNPDTGAGEACEIVRDTCTAVETAQHCATWHQRVRDAEAAPRSVTSTRAAQSLQDEHQRLQKLWDSSDCAEPK